MLHVKICDNLYAMWNYTFSMLFKDLGQIHVYLYCLLQDVHSDCSGSALCFRHSVDLWLFPVWGEHNNYVLLIHHLWQPSGVYALCHALSFF